MCLESGPVLLRLRMPVPGHKMDGTGGVGLLFSIESDVSLEMVSALSSPLQALLSCWSVLLAET